MQSAHLAHGGRWCWVGWLAVSTHLFGRGCSQGVGAERPGLNQPVGPSVGARAKASRDCVSRIDWSQPARYSSASKPAQPNWPITVTQAPVGSEAEFNNDIVLRFKASERGAAAVINPRYVVKNTG